MGVRESLARNARTPHVAGLLVAAVAAVFTSVWLLIFVTIDGSPGDESMFFVGFFLLVTPVNAYGVTRLAWRRWVAGRPGLGPRRAAAVGAVIGLLSYLTLAFAFSAAGHVAIALSEPAAASSSLDVAGFVSSVVMVGVIGVFYGLLLTAGVPVVLSVGAALLLSRLDPVDPAGDDESGRRPMPRDAVGPPG